MTNDDIAKAKAIGTRNNIKTANSPKTAKLIGFHPFIRLKSLFYIHLAAVAVRTAIGRFPENTNDTLNAAN
jgi:hypothetical protein